MIPTAALEAAAGVGAVIVFLGSIAFALRRLGFRFGAAAPASAPNGPSSEVTSLLQGQDQLRERVTVLETQMGELQKIRSNIQIVHKRLDEVANSTHTMAGEVAALNRTSSLILEALLKREVP